MSEYPFRFCILHIVKVIAGNHFSDRLLVLLSVAKRTRTPEAQFGRDAIQAIRNSGTQNQSRIRFVRKGLLTFSLLFYRTEYSMDAVPIPRGSITSSTPYFF
jgi:hypothetical protein